MPWLYGQTWLWYLIAFLVGVLLAWLLLVRPQLRRRRALQDGPTGSTRPGGTDPDPTPDPGHVDIRKDRENPEQTRPDARATTDDEASGDGSVATGAVAAEVGATAVAATAASRPAADRHHPDGPDAPDGPDNQGSADRVEDGSAVAEPGTAAGEPVVLAPQPVVAVGTDHDTVTSEPGRPHAEGSGSAAADPVAADTTDGGAAEVHVPDDADPAEAAEVDPADVGTSTVSDDDDDDRDDVDTTGIPVVSRDGGTEVSEPATDRLPTAEPATEQLPVTEHTSEPATEQFPATDHTVEPATEQLPAAEPETERFHAVDPALSTLDTAAARSSSGLDVGDDGADGGRAETGTGVGATAAGAEGPGAVAFTHSTSDTHSASDTESAGGTEPHGGTGTVGGAGPDESGTAPTDRRDPVGDGDLVDGDPASATSSGVGSDRPAPFGPGSARAESDGSAPSADFTIKGNANSMLFHPPESPYYVRTQAEVWFVTEEDAEAAGFRRWRPKT